MSLKLYNSMSKKLEEFKSVTNDLVRMYNCGPTVYSYAHIGNFRSYLLADLLRRYLEFKGYQVDQVVNITDVGHLTDDGDEGEDKLDVAAKREKKHPLEIAQFYTDQFIADWKTLNMREPLHRPKATETIQEMIALIEQLIKEGHAYVAGANVYYDVTTFKDYGKLSGNDLEKLGNHRCDVDPNKRHKHDFVLWFGESKFKNHILKWDSPWGEGYPGWHIECSAMAVSLLSDAFSNNAFDKTKFETIDIHTGGEDNKFPHHECEIAQTSGATQKPFANFWLHATHLQSEGQKMSKSIGNVYNVFELVKEGYNPRAIRYLLLSAHYRQTLNFTKDGLVAAQKSLDRIDRMLKALNNIQEEKDIDETLALHINNLKLVVEKEMDNDLNISGAFGAVFEAVNKINSHLDHLGKQQAQEIVDIFFDLDEIFGVLDKFVLQEQELPSDVQELLNKRAAARNEKNWQESDKLRDQIHLLGYTVKDGKDGQVVEKN